MFYPHVVICFIYPESTSWYSVPNREVWNSYSDVLSISSRHQVAGRIKMITPFWLYSSGLPHQVENKLDWIAVFHGIYRTKCSNIPPYFEVVSADPECRFIYSSEEGHGIAMSGWEVELVYGANYHQESWLQPESAIGSDWALWLWRFIGWVWTCSHKVVSL